jgi:hypothetical protein
MIGIPMMAEVDKPILLPHRLSIRTTTSTQTWTAVNGDKYTTTVTIKLERKL